MPSFNKVILMGNLTRDPEMRFLPSNTAVAQISLAVNERWKSKQTDQWEERVHFVDCEAFGRIAENLNKFFSKGRPIFIEGRLRLDQWEDRQSGQKRSKLKVVIDTWQFVDSKDSAGGNGGGSSGSSRDGGRPSNGYGNRQDDQDAGGWDDNSGGGSHEAVDEEDIPF